MRKLIIGFFVVLGLILAVGAFFWFTNQNGDGAEVTVDVPEKIATGVPFDVVVAVTNTGNAPLELPEVAITLPSDMLFQGSGKKNIEIRTIETLEEGERTEERFTVIATGAENRLKTIKASVAYETGAFQSRFEKSISKEIVITDAGIFVDAVLPAKLLSGKAFELVLEFENQAEQDFENIVFELVHPETFTVREFSEVPDEEGNTFVWKRDTFAKDTAEKITLTGMVTDDGVASDDFLLRAVYKTPSQSYVINEKSAPVQIEPSPLALSVSLRSGKEHVINPGETLQYILRYENNTNVGLQDVIITAAVQSSMIDMRTVKTDGFLSARDNKITWNASRITKLKTLAPGESGEVQFSVKVSDTYPESSKNNMVKIFGEIQSPTVPRFISASETVGSGQATHKIRGNLELASKGYFRDAKSGVVNDGSVPPRVGAPTEYTIHWELVNEGADLEDVTVTAFLGPNVRYTGVSKEGIGAVPVYNERTQQVTWTLPALQANKGRRARPAKLIFQVEIIPAVGQVGSPAVLVNKATVTAKDVFSGVTLTHEVPEVFTTVRADTTISGGEGVVVE